MTRATWVQTNFNGGEWSPLAYGRYDLKKYGNGLAKCVRFIPMQQGGLARCPGARFVALATSNANASRLQPFEFSVTQAYMLEFGNHSVRVFLNEGALLNSDPAPSAYNAGTTYAIGTLVSESGAVYYCKAPTVGHEPSNTTYWHPQPGTTLEIYSPYTSAEIWQLNFSQSADTIYITHPNHPVMKLQRAAATTWPLTVVPFRDGPYGNVNTTATTLTPSAVTGAATVTASSTEGINNGAGFRASDVGRLLRIKCVGVWLWGTITAVTDTTHITWTVAALDGSLVPRTATGVVNLSGGSIFGVTLTSGGGGYGVTPPSVVFRWQVGGGSGEVQAIGYATLTNGVVTGVTMSVTGTGYEESTTVHFAAPSELRPGITSFWRLGLWNSTDGYPSCVGFHQDRLCLAGAAQSPGRIDMSNTADPENFSPSNLDGTVVDSNALAFGISTGVVNAIRWMMSDEWGLLIGTAGGEHALTPSGAQQALTASNVYRKPLSNYGSSIVAPVRVGKATLFIQRTGRKLREMFYQFTADSFQILDISLVGEHLTKSGFKQLAVQLAPQQIVWGVRNDGVLVGMTYDKDQDVCGWHQHPLGGYSDADHLLAPLVESVGCIPAPGVQRDEVWLEVQRYINGAVVRTIEVFSKMWEDGDTLALANFLDCSAEYNGVATTTISGLTWAVGETVGVLADGASHPDCLVNASGEITLQRSTLIAQVGFKYKSYGKTLRPEVGGMDGPAQGKLKRVFAVVFRFFQTLGISLGSDSPGVVAYPMPFRSSDDPMGTPPALYDGDKRWNYEQTWSPDGSIYFETSDPTPCNITLLTAHVDTQDG